MKAIFVQASQKVVDAAHHGMRPRLLGAILTAQRVLAASEGAHQRCSCQELLLPQVQLRATTHSTVCMHPMSPLSRCHRMLVRAPQKHAHHCILPSLLGVASLPFISFSRNRTRNAEARSCFCRRSNPGLLYTSPYACVLQQPGLACILLSATRHVISAAQQMFPLVQGEVVLPIELTRLLLTLP